MIEQLNQYTDISQNAGIIINSLAIIINSLAILIVAILKK